MTLVTVVTTITTIDSGRVELGDLDLGKVSVGQVKRLIEQESNNNVPAYSQKLWWRGYILDENTLPLTRACVGVNEGETVNQDGDPNTLLLFMTVDLPKRDIDFPSSPKPTRLRSYSFDVEKVRAELKQKQKTRCLIS